MTGERLSGREPRGPYRDFPWLPSWNQVMAREGLNARLGIIKAALEPARRLKPASPDQIKPIGLADWVGSPESRAGLTIALGDGGEKADFGDGGQLLSRRQYRHDERSRPTTLVEADYNNPRTEPLSTANPVAVRVHGWVYDDGSEARPLAGASYSEYAHTPAGGGLTSQSVLKCWFVPSMIMPSHEPGLIAARLGAAGEITAHYLGGKLKMLSARVSGPGLAISRRLKVELSDGLIGAVELVDRLPGSAQEATFAARRSPDGKLIQASLNPLAGLSRRQPAKPHAILDQVSSS